MEQIRPREEVLTEALLQEMGRREKNMLAKGRYGNRLWEAVLIVRRARAIQEAFDFKMDPEDRRTVSEMKTLLDAMLMMDDAKCT